MNFTNIACISGNGGAAVCSAFSRPQGKSHLQYGGTWGPFQSALEASRPQTTHLSVFVDWFGNPLGSRISSDSFMEGINEDNLKKCMWDLYQPSKTAGLSKFPSGVQLSTQQPTEGFGQIIAG